MLESGGGYTRTHKSGTVCTGFKKTHVVRKTNTEQLCRCSAVEVVSPSKAWIRTWIDDNRQVRAGKSAG